MTAVDIDDAEAAYPKGDSWRTVEASIVGTAMPDQLRHRREALVGDRGRRPDGALEDPADSTHDLLPPTFPFASCSPSQSMSI